MVPAAGLQAYKSWLLVVGVLPLFQLPAQEQSAVFAHQCPAAAAGQAQEL